MGFGVGGAERRWGVSLIPAAESSSSADGFVRVRRQRGGPKSDGRNGAATAETTRRRQQRRQFPSAVATAEASPWQSATASRDSATTMHRLRRRRSRRRRRTWSTRPGAPRVPRIDARDRAGAPDDRSTVGVNIIVTRPRRIQLEGLHVPEHSAWQLLGTLPIFVIAVGPAMPSNRKNQRTDHHDGGDAAELPHDFCCRSAASRSDVERFVEKACNGAWRTSTS